MRVMCVFFYSPPPTHTLFFFFLFSEKDISDLELPTGDTMILMKSVGELQTAKGGGPLCTRSTDDVLPHMGINTQHR